ncbi:gluconokinase [Paenibacillus sp. GCM10012307]|uniref:Gluconokinase n=1 Tax=Paenibacillus roseus TaxID=2798579 RepID=A0A934J8W2_9BACL|nr:gluconokinase [Paenibacillus roseus]MBJ6362428.1 gluconokinase [Paenibacillus roseus]
MDSASYMIGVDIGTTSTKAVLFQEGGRAINRAGREYPLYTSVPDSAEQGPEEIFAAVLDVVRQVMNLGGITPSQVMFVSFSSAMHSVIPVDAEGQPLMRCLTWADNRSAGWSEKFRHELGGHEVYRRTGTPVHPMSPITKLLWLRHDKPELFHKASKFVSIKEYIFAKLFGEYVVDYSVASATGLMNLEQLDWDQEALLIAGITGEQLSRLVPTTHKLEGLRKEYAAAMGLSEATPFIIGAADGVLSNLGVNAIEPGAVAVTIGTSGAIRTVIDRPVTDPQGRTFCYALTERHWVIGGAVNNGGMLLRWVRDQWAAYEEEKARSLGVDVYDLLTEMAGTIRAGSDGLLFHPYLTGERAPLWNPDARGSFFGLTMRHGKAHMIRSVMEGVIFNLYEVLLAMEKQTGQPLRIMATGGFARSPLWRQILADIFGQRVVVPESFESSCLGAVVLGLYATGRIDSLNAVSEMVGASHEHDPDLDNAALYRELLPIYTRLSHKLKDEYRAIAAFQRK